MNGFRTRRKGKKSSARNLHAEKGRPVTLNEVIANGCEGHLACNQLGRIWSVERGRWEPCSRATKRFYKDHPEVIVDKQGRAWWPAESDEAADARAGTSMDGTMGEDE